MMCLCSLVVTAGISQTRRGAAIIVAISALGSGISCASALPTGAAVTSFEVQASKATVNETSGTLHFTFVTPRVVRVVFSPPGVTPKLQNFVVRQKGAAVAVKNRSNSENVILQTAGMTVRISRAQGNVSFRGPHGAALLAEPSTGGHCFVQPDGHGAGPDPQQTFEAAAHEVILGLAQTQDGLWNRRGMPIELRQLNTQCAVPLLVSSKGYGIMWNNASLTEFNPVDQQVSLNPRKQGAFKPLKTGTYVLMVRGGNRAREIGIKLNGHLIADIQNMWVPYTISAKVRLIAGRLYHLAIVGGGGGTTLWQRLRGHKTVFRAGTGNAIDYYFFAGPTPGDVIKSYRSLTGAAPMLPRWAYGFWQCRERYSSQQQILQRAAEFRTLRIPVDLIVQDWRYWGHWGWSAFRFSSAHYPNPAAMLQQLHGMHFHYMISVWQNNTYHSAPYLPKLNGAIKGWLNVFNPAAARVRWYHMKRAFFNIGVDAWWQDATEPGDDGNALGTMERRNAYPLFANQNLYYSQRATSSAKRVVILSRSAYLGQQRAAAVTWSGDIGGTWQYYRRQISAGLNFCAAGIPYWTTDTGGFFRPADQYTSKAYHELLVRWFEWSTFCPILRIHGWESRTEMWNYGKSTMALLRRFDIFRYRMLPYIYSVAWNVTHNGASIMQPLMMVFPNDRKAAAASHEYMFGPDFLVAPVLQPMVGGQGHTSVYLPAGVTWINFWTGKIVVGGQTVSVKNPLSQMPLFVRAGSLLPLGPQMQWATQKAADPIELRVYPGASGRFTLYEDQNNNYNYEKGMYATIPLSYSAATHTLTIGTRQGSFPGMRKARTFDVAWVGPANATGIRPAAHTVLVRYSGQRVTLHEPQQP